MTNPFSIRMLLPLLSTSNGRQISGRDSGSRHADAEAPRYPTRPRRPAGKMVATPLLLVHTQRFAEPSHFAGRRIWVGQWNGAYWAALAVSPPDCTQGVRRNHRA